jgi:hypothetical protein
VRTNTTSEPTEPYSIVSPHAESQTKTEIALAEASANEQVSRKDSQLQLPPSRSVSVLRVGKMLHQSVAIEVYDRQALAFEFDARSEPHLQALAATS